ncbi:MAG: hypothetical protein ABI321_06120 [Polyangia bacterium]
MTRSPERQQRIDEAYARLTNSVDYLVAAFNREVGNPGWVGARADYMHAMRLAFEASGLDCSSFMTASEMSLRQRIVRDGDRLVLVGEPG